MGADGSVQSADLSDGQEIETLQGEAVTVGIDGSTVKVNEATVTGADVMATNGVIHIIDGVLTPPTVDIMKFYQSCPGAVMDEKPPPPPPGDEKPPPPPPKEEESTDESSAPSTTTTTFAATLVGGAAAIVTLFGL